MPETVVVRMRHRRFTAMTMPGGIVAKWARQRSQHTKTLAKRHCPVRTHRLRESINHEYKKVPNGCQFFVYAKTYYAKYVHEGTGDQHGFRRFKGRPPGQGSRGYWRPGMQHALVGGKWPRASKTGVNGQESQPFLAQALGEVMRDL